MSILLIAIQFFLTVLGVMLGGGMVCVTIILAIDMVVGYFRERKIQKATDQALEEYEKAQSKAVKTKESILETLAKENIRREKERVAHEGFFEESYVRGFDANGAILHRGVKVPTEKALEYYELMDRLETTRRLDTERFKQTEDL